MQASTAINNVRIGIVPVDVRDVTVVNHHSDRPTSSPCAPTSLCERDPCGSSPRSLPEAHLLRFRDPLASSRAAPQSLPPPPTPVPAPVHFSGGSDGHRFIPRCPRCRRVD